MQIEMFRCLLVIVVSVQKCLSSNEPSVVTDTGKIVGHYLTSFKGDRYEAYQGIPYAEAPIGERRFEPPEPIMPWSGELLANRLRDTCWQYGRNPFPSGSLVQGSEDCLYLNVYAPARRVNSSLPVLLYIHGGGFHFGGNADGEEYYLMDHGVLVVTIQYRLGVLGFLSSEDDAVSGNMGLKDQSLALRWVSRNIERFGGDPRRITLFGDSAGASSVHYHYLSPWSAGLFNNGISFSGTALNCWALAENSRDKAVQLARLMNCSASDVPAMIRCLKTRSARDLTEAQATFKPWRHNPAVPFGPVVEKNTSKGRAFIDSSPMDIITSGRFYDVPWITTVVSEEGLFPVAEYANDDDLKDLDDKWDAIAPLLLDFNYTIPRENHTMLSRKIRQHYFGERPIDKKTLMNLVYLVGDRWFVVDAENAVRAHAAASQSAVWFYYYNYRATDSMSARANSTENLGVCHGDDIFLFMKNDVLIPTKSPRDMAMLEDLIKLVTSFAHDGKPDVNAKWNRVDPTKTLNYLHIAGPGNFKMKTVDNLAEEEFWNSIDFDENKVKPTG